MESLFVRLSQRNVSKMMMSFAKIRREQAFLIWLDISKDSKNKQQLKVKVDEEKLIALRRIVQRNYLKLFKEINRKLWIVRKVATHLACKSRINQQNSLWRLLVNAEKKRQFP